MRALAIVLGVCLLAPSVAQAQEAGDLQGQARALAEEGRYAEAIAKLRQADGLEPDPLNDCNIARLYRLMGKAADAQLQLAQCESRLGGGGALDAEMRANLAVAKDEID